MSTSPVRMRRAKAVACSTSVLNTLPLSPKSVASCRAAASSSVSYRATEITGPKISSRKIRMDGLVSVKIVGSR